MQSEVLLSLLFPPLLHVVMNALLSEGTWHCKMAILIYLYFIALSFLSNIGTITSQNFPAIPSQKHHSESSHLSFSCLRFHVIFSVKQLKHSKIWNCHLGYCNTKYVDDHSYPINSFCYLQLKSTNPINTIFFFYMSIHWSYHWSYHPTMDWHFLLFCLTHQFIYIQQGI